MALVTIQEVLDFVGAVADYFVINASNDVLKLTYDAGTVKSVDIPDGTYEPAALATAIQTAANTALTASITVTWSSTTRKFTFSAGAGHTLTYTHAGSDAGLLVGFNQDHAAALTLVSDQACGNPTNNLSILKAQVEKQVKNYCGKDFEATTYTEYFDGDGDTDIFLEHYPIVSINRLAIGFLDVLIITNTSEYTTATVAVTSTGIVLTKDGVASTLLFADYATLALMAAAIAAVGSGWSASLRSTDYNNYQSSELIERFGACTIGSAYVYLQIPDRAKSAFTVYPDEGIVSYGAQIPIGRRNVMVNYTAYSTVPDDIKGAVLMWVKYLNQVTKDNALGLSGYNLGDVGASFTSLPMPKEVKSILDNNGRIFL